MMRVLTVRPPWSHALFEPNPTLRKQVENRSWATHDTPERIGIHVGLTVDHEGESFIGEALSAADTMDRGHIIGTVEVVGCHVAGSPGCSANGCYGSMWAFFAQVPDADAVMKQRSPIVHWMLEAPRRFVTPIRARGMVGLWPAGDSVSHLMSIAEVRS